MAKGNRHTVFEGLHPACAALYFIAVIVLSMSAIHPILLAISLVAGVAYNMRLRGVAQTGKSLVWQLPLLLIIMVMNPVFSQFGSTVLLRVGTWALYGESLAYGACMGCLLVATFQWFSNAAQVLTADKITALTGKFAPVTGLLLTMTMRLVPQFVRRGTYIADVRNACTSASGSEGGLSSRMRQITVLMSWGMEDSLETADAMRAKGWGAVGARTSYSRQDFRGLDAVACLMLAALVVLCIACAAAICGQFVFYPAMGTWASWPLYLPFACLAFLPLVLEVLPQ